MSVEPIQQATLPSTGGDTTITTKIPRLRVRAESLSHAGRVRSNNEDHFLVATLAKSLYVQSTSLSKADPLRFSREEGYLMVVADGMGGAVAGERASALAIESVETFVLESLKWFLHQRSGAEENALIRELSDGLRGADRAVTDAAEADRTLEGMGTTLTMAYAVADELAILHAGDSRAYLYRAGGLEQLTRDHTVVQDMVEDGLITAEDARTHRKRHVITNVVGGPYRGVEAEVKTLKLRAGDRILLCSDGLIEPLRDFEIATILQAEPEIGDACKRLIDAALSGGAPDNVTVIVARVDAA
jgi:serine/threonine protein phosphatase PrpC